MFLLITSNFVQSLVVSVKGNENENKYRTNYSFGYIRTVCQNYKEAHERFFVACHIQEIKKLETLYVIIFFSGFKSVVRKMYKYTKVYLRLCYLFQDAVIASVSKRRFI